MRTMVKTYTLQEMEELIALADQLFDENHTVDIYQSFLNSQELFGEFLQSNPDFYDKETLAKICTKNLYVRYVLMLKVTEHLESKYLQYKRG